jgi:hypothetical protein
MSGYLLDTNIISEYNRTETPHPGVVKWIETPLRSRVGQNWRGAFVFHKQ